MTFAVVTFPGSNCDLDCIRIVKEQLGCDIRQVFHKESSLGSCDAVIIPGGFSYGDYLRVGALAKFSPIMSDIIRVARTGKPVIGICNGFQILCEAGLLPGALVRNAGIRYVSRVVNLRVENAETLFTNAYLEGQELQIPISHGDGCYIADQNTIRTLEENNRVLFRYIGPVREDVPGGNPNGSTHAIAGIMNEHGNVMGMMPHPERASDPLTNGSDGLGVFQSIVASVTQIRVPAIAAL
jgi:phosphoribosylformylglycinamidine synthase